VPLEHASEAIALLGGRLATEEDGPGDVGRTVEYWPPESSRKSPSDRSGTFDSSLGL